VEITKEQREQWNEFFEVLNKIQVCYYKYKNENKKTLLIEDLPTTYGYKGKVQINIDYFECDGKLFLYNSNWKRTNDNGCEKVGFLFGNLWTIRKKNFFKKKIIPRISPYNLDDLPVPNLIADAIEDCFKKFTENIEEYTYLLKNNLKNYKMELAKEIFNL
jgi:hypothetical protein